MPYIKPEDRQKLIGGVNPATAGELNFCLTMIITDYLRDKNLSYQTINDIVGALEGAKAEFQRRVVSNYEDQKIKENGDLY